MVQFSKVLSLIDVTPPGMVTLIRLTQLLNAPFPMLVTPSGMTTLFRVRHKKRPNSQCW
jgi:hypothetical protein